MILILLLAVATVLSASAAFVLGRIRYAVISLAICAFGSALLLLYAGQAAIAIMQFFVFASGSATFLLVTVSDENNGTMRRRAFLVTALGIGVSFALLLQGFGMQSGAGQGSMLSSAGAALEGQYALMYVAVFILFVAAVISVVALKSFSRRYL